MKKIITLIVLVTILGNFFSPFGLVFQKNEPFVNLDLKVSHAQSSLGGMGDGGAAQNPQGAGIPTSTTNSGGDCSFLNPGGWFNCMVKYLMELLFRAAGLFLGMAAFLMDLSIRFSVIDVFSNAGLVGDGSTSGGVVGGVWKVLRDLGNLTFIFILLYIAITTILGKGDGNIMKTLIWVIVIAVIVNFSLFFTKIIIDVSNILALLFYKALGGKNISDIFQAGLNLQTFGGIGGASSLSLIFFGYGLGIIGIVLTTFIFLATAITFVIRSVALLFLMMLSPLAFIAFLVPLTRKYLKDWFSYLMRFSFVAPVALFFLYVNGKLIYGLQSVFSATGNANFAGNISKFGTVAIQRSDFAPILGFVVIILGLFMGFKLTNKVSGGVANIAGEYAGKGLGFALGGVTGGALRATVGLGGRKLADRLEKSAFAGTRTGKAILQTARGAANSSFDVRRSKLVQKGAKTADINLGKGSDTSYDKNVEKVKKGEEKYINSLKSNEAKRRYMDNLARPLSNPGAIPLAGLAGGTAGLISFVRGRRAGEKAASAGKAREKLEKDIRRKEQDEALAKSREEELEKLATDRKAKEEELEKFIKEAKETSPTGDLTAPDIIEKNKMETEIKRLRRNADTLTERILRDEKQKERDERDKNRSGGEKKEEKEEEPKK